MTGGVDEGGKVHVGWIHDGGRGWTKDLDEQASLSQREGLHSDRMTT